MRTLVFTAEAPYIDFYVGPTGRDQSLAVSGSGRLALLRGARAAPLPWPCANGLGWQETRMRRAMPSSARDS